MLLGNLAETADCTAYLNFEGGEFESSGLV